MKLEMFLFTKFYFFNKAYILLSKIVLIHKLKFFWYFYFLSLGRLIPALTILVVYLQLQRNEIDEIMSKIFSTILTVTHKICYPYKT
jgi:hypothetical protein